MADDGPSDDAVLYTVDADHAVFEVKDCNVLSLIGLHVSKISNVSYFILGAGMSHSVGVKVGTSCLAAFDEIP